METHTQALPAGTRLGNYSIDALLGVGGFGVTYKAKEHFTDRPVAIKEYLPRGIALRGRDGHQVEPIGNTAEADFSWGLARFRQEAKLLIGLKHPNIVPVLSYFEANGTGYLAMEFQEGRSLGRILRDDGKLSEEELLDLLAPLLSGVEEVHRNGILHRDIKPDNILVRTDGSPVLLDFGAARQALTLHSRGFTAVLSEGYGPPEQYSPDGNQGPWTDVYALGAVMYHCLRGTRPVDALARLRADPLPRDLAQLRTVSPSLASAIERALAVRDTERPQSVADLRELIWPQTAETLVLGGQDYTVRGVRDRGWQGAHEHESVFTLADSGPQRVRLGKYAPLYAHLVSLKGSEWRATFGELERLLGFGLPRSARTHRPWWGNVRTNTSHRHAVAWRSAGWRVDQVDIGSEKVVFVREKRGPLSQWHPPRDASAARCTTCQGGRKRIVCATRGYFVLNPRVRIMPYDAPKSPLFLRLNPADDVVIALREVAAGTKLEGEGVVAADTIPPGHKVAVHAKRTGEAVRRYGQIIGFASQDIAPGQHVHTHNLEMRDFARDYAFGQDVRPLEPVAEPATFMGIVRKDGRVATRNYIGVISTVNCSASVWKWVADAFRGDALREFPNVDGIVPLTHQTGCGMASTGEGIDVLRRTIAGYARHSNFGGVLIIGLGCEANQMDALFFTQNLKEEDLLKPLIIQQQGGTAKTVEAGIDAVKRMLPLANNVTRERVPASHIVVGLQCGGSDGYSGITANPALGAAADLLARHGGTAILSETPEIYGAEHLLTRRAVSREVGEKLIARLKWWQDYTARNRGDMNNNPSPGNKAGGLTTILEKSLGAAAKGGTTNLVDVYEYAEKVTAKGFVFMDTPGYDPCSITGQVAGGANMVVFTTGRGSVYGCKPAPSIKLATNARIYRHMADDMDVNCGTIVEGGATVAEKGKEIFDLILRVASGERSKSEALGFGADEFIPWQIGAVM